MAKPTKVPAAAKVAYRNIGGRRITTVIPGDSDETRADDHHYFENYTEYSKTLRTWLVAYGIGAPVLFFTNEKLTSVLAKAAEKELVIFLFLAGLAGQVLLAFLNKWCAWYIYAGENDRSFRKKRGYRVWAWINEQSLLDLIVDALSLIAFCWSTWLVLNILL